MMMSPQLCHVTNVYDFMSSSVSPQTTKLGRMVDQHGNSLASDWW